MTVCDACGHENAAGSRFCNGCGAALTTVAEPAGVRKTVTVVFCDLVGSTALGERSDPEVLREIMGRYHAELRRVLEHHGGTVEKFVGDAAMAVFGIPQVHEDDALRAVHAALGMRAAVEPLGLQVRIGVNTGEVVAGSGETLVTGDAVNVAARLEQHASTGEILIGAATRELVRDAIQLEPVDPLTVKGKSEPLPAYRVIDRVAGTTASRLPPSSPFVGRTQELELLEQAFAVAADKRQPQLVTVVGPPGIGKSRLVRELLDRLPARVVGGRCLSYGDAITYWPLLQIVESVGDVDAALATDTDAPLIAARIAAITSTDIAIAAEEIAWGFRRLFENLAREQPLVVVFDDIHWADASLLDLIDYVASFAQDVPLLLLCTARPELFESRPAWATPQPQTLLVKLEPLPESQTERLVTALGDLSADLRMRVVEAADGNPLFVEQLVAMHAESGTDDLEVPAGLHALLAARIDRLDPKERAVVERGSVEGRVFHRGPVTHLLPEPERPDVGSRLLALVRRELIRADRSTMPGDDGFRFGHMLIRDAAYESIPKRLRAELHERYADWLVDRLGDGAPPEIVGYHLDQAYRYRDELGEKAEALGERAAEQLARAAHSTRLRQDNAAEVTLLSRAVELVGHLPAVKSRLLLAHGRALHEAGSLDVAAAVLDEAEVLAREVGDTHTEWCARMEAATVRFRRQPEGAAEAAIAMGNEAIAAGIDDEVLARAWRLLSEAASFRGRSAEDWQAINHAIHHARATGDRALVLEYVMISFGPVVIGNIPVTEGTAYAGEVAAEFGDVPSVMAFATHVEGHAKVRLGDFDGGIAALQAWAEHFRELGEEMRFARAVGCVWDGLSLAQDWAAGERVLREACDILERHGEKSFRSTMVAFMGLAVAHQGRIDEAAQLSELSQALGAPDDDINEAMWRIVRAYVLASRGERDAAVAMAQEAVHFADRMDIWEAQADCRMDLARILLPNDPAAARVAVEEALDRYERKGNPVSAGRARDLLAACQGG